MFKQFHGGWLAVGLICAPVAALAGEEGLPPASEVGASYDPASANDDAAAVLETADRGDASESATPLATIPVPSADAPPPMPQGDVPANRLIEEVIVTSQKREERLQDVPISITAFSEDKLEALGIDSVQDVQRATPGFTVTQSSGFNVTFLRGVGSDAFLPGVDSSVPFYLDGIPLLAIQGTSDTLGRIERVEVLKGPQGTLFGRNATGGAVNVITPEPDQVFSADMSYDVGLGRYGHQSGQVYVNLPLGDSAAMSIAGFESTRDNTVRNIGPGKLPNLYARGGRVKLHWDVVDDVSLSLSGTYQETSTEGGLLYQLVRPAPIIGAVLPADPKLDRTVSLDTSTNAENRSYLLGGTLVWRSALADVKLIGSMQRAEVPRLNADFDNTAMPLLVATAGGGGARQVYHQDTAELQFLSNAETPFSDKFEWVAGFFYLKSDGGLQPVTFEVAQHALSTLLPRIGPTLEQSIDALLGAVGLPPLTSDGVKLANSGGLDNKSYSAYGQGTYHLTDTVDVTAGIRYQKETRDLVDSHTSVMLKDGRELPVPVPQGNTPTLKPKLTSGRFALQWRPVGPDTQFYASWARGYKNPTYNTVNLLGNLFGTMVPVKEERVDTYELGAKTQLFDKRLQFNAAAFYTIQENPLSGRVAILTGGVVDYINAGQAKIKGFEFDGLAVPFPNLDPGLVITGGMTYLDAKYTDFVNGRGYDDVTGLAFGQGGATLPPRDLSGKRIPRVPEWSAVAAINQRIELGGDHALEFGVDTSYASKLYFLPQNSELSKREPVQLFNAHVSYDYLPWNTELTAYVTNITDKVYAETAFISDFGTSLVVNTDPRQYGLRVKVSFY